MGLQIGFIQSIIVNGFTFLSQFFNNLSTIADVPIRVEYEITDKAKELGPILVQLAQWGAKA